MTYSVKEMFYTLQGEGANSGRPAVFCRFAGCNLWTGREEDRATATCKFCDTDFVGTDGIGGGKFTTAADLAARANSFWPGEDRLGRRLVVLTGGEPLLQVDHQLIDALHGYGFDWICVSPKAGAEWRQRSGNELKVIWPQAGIDLHEMELAGFEHRFLQPMDGSERQANTQLCIDQCLTRPGWKLSLQTHKITGIR
jgi:7-carboxy-7-deazaguanine synthase